MIFPNTKIRMKLLDKIKLGITGGGGTIGGMIATISKVAAAMEPMAIIMALGGFAGVLWRQVSNIFTQRTKYMAALSRHLYFYNMDNNRGALNHMIELANKEEAKEAMLAYYFLFNKPEITEAGLDKCVEDYIYETYGTHIDFDSSDALSKLDRYDLLIENQNLYSVVPLQQAYSGLKYQWNELF